MASLPVRPDRIKGLTNIWSVPNSDETLEIKRHLLTAGADLKLSPEERRLVSDKGLLEVELILVDRRKPALPKSSVVLELGEDLPIRIGMDIRAQLQALQQVARRRLMPDAEGRRVVGFEAFPQVRAE